MKGGDICFNFTGKSNLLMKIYTMLQQMLVSRLQSITRQFNSISKRLIKKHVEESCTKQQHERVYSSMPDFHKYLGFCQIEILSDQTVLYLLVLISIIDVI